MEYKAAGKAWLDSVVKDEEEAYIRLFNKLSELGSPYIDNFDQADREQVFKCIRDKTGRFLNDDDFVTYVETEEEKKKPKYVFTCDAKLALTDYYNAVHMLCEAQQNFAKSTQVLEKKIEDKSVFLDIIKQVQLTSVKMEIRTVEEMEKMEGKTYKELTLMCHLPNFKRINPNAKDQTRMMAAYIYFVLYKQITGIRSSQTGCATDFRCPTTPFKRLVTGKKQPGRPGRLGEVRGRIQQKHGRSHQNGRPYPCQDNKKSKQISNSNNIHTQRQRPRKDEARRVRRLSKPSEQIGRTVRLDIGLGG